MEFENGSHEEQAEPSNRVSNTGRVKWKKATVYRIAGSHGRQGNIHFAA